jgi:protein-S-isoprenylcysteine O-methyltransferase Ste14
MVEIPILVLGSFLIAYFSRNSFSKPCTHGFFRFFAWEFILIQFAFNLDSWFLNRLAWYQCISWFLLTVSIFLLIEGIRLIKKYGEPETTFETTTTLVKNGIFQYIRHPMYASLLFLTWGIFFKSPSSLDFGLVIISTFFLYATARMDEKESIAKFGNEYLDYLKTTRMFIPYIF